MLVNSLSLPFTCTSRYCFSSVSRFDSSLFLQFKACNIWRLCNVPSPYKLLSSSSSSSCQTANASSSSTNLILLQWHPSYRITDRIKLSLKKRFPSSKLSVKAYKLLATNQAQTIIQEDGNSNLWEEIKQSLSAFHFNIEEADLILKKAFGWIHSPYWGEERRKEIPQFDSIKEMLDYLKSLSLSDDDLHKILKKFPEVLGCSLNEEVKVNVETLDREWGIKGKTLRNLLLRNPKVLGYNVDCKGDCMAKCTRCWVRF